jgi:hypothetical protein
VAVTHPHERLQDALRALDAAFAPFCAQPLSLSGCTHCYAPAEIETLAGPVHRVPEELIPSVAAKEAGHWDDFPALYRRMTPRIVRLLATGRLHVDHGLVASQLVKAGWRNWAPPERSALENVWHAWWRSALHEYPGTEPVTGVLEAISVSTGTLLPWLAVWAGTRTEAADRHLRDALDGWLFEAELADLRFGFYGEMHATPDLLAWSLSLGEGRIGAARRAGIERIARG